MELLGALAGFLIGNLLIILAIYIAISVFLNKFNKLVYGKGTLMCWIPIANVYLYSISVTVLLIYAIIKYNKLKKNK